MAANGEQERNHQPAPQPQGGPAGGGGFTLSGKTLGIAGGGAAALVVVIVVVVLLVTGVFGGGGGGGASGGSDVLAYVPGDAGMVGIGDNNAFLNGDVPEDYVEWMEEDSEDSGDYGISSETYKTLDIKDDDVALFAMVADQNLNDTLEIVQGDFEYDVIREELEDGLDCEEDDYRGFELWECPGQKPPAVALFEKGGYVVMAIERQDDLEDMLTLKSRTPEKLADAEESELKNILNQVGDGWLRFAFLTDECVIERCEGMAFAIQKSDDSDSIPASYAVKFSSERAATAAEGDIAIDDLVEGLFEGFALDLDIGEVKAAGEFVVGDGIAEFVEPDDASSSNVNGGGNDRAGRSQPAATNTPGVVAVPPTASLQQENVSLDPWVEDCSRVVARADSVNRVGLVRWSDYYPVCECMHDSIVDLFGPPPGRMSDFEGNFLSDTSPRDMTTLRSDFYDGHTVSSREIAAAAWLSCS